MTQSEMIYRKAVSWMEEHRMIPEHAFAAAGVSGGADSVVMLHILCRLREKEGFRLAAVHVNHGIRGDEAERDEEFVRFLCESWGVEPAFYRYDVPALASRDHLSTEEAGRMARREAFACFRAERVPPETVFRTALAHNINDLGETVIHNLARGTGLRGLCSMKPVSGEIIRPVLCLSRDEILIYADENGISYQTDSTNLSDEYTRNRIRRHVMPYLTEHVNPQAALHIAETAGMAADAADYLERKAGEILKQCLAAPEGGGEGETFLGKSYETADKALKPYVILEAFGLLAGKRKDFTARHVRDVMDLGEGGAGRRIDLPCGISAVKEKNGIRLSRDGFRAARRPAPVLREYFCAYSGQEIPRKIYTKWFDYDKIPEKVVFRTRQAGDYMVIHPDGRTKKLTRIMIDDGIPGDIRDPVTVAAAGHHVLWIAGGRSSCGFRVSRDTKTVLVLEMEDGPDGRREGLTDIGKDTEHQE